MQLHHWIVLIIAAVAGYYIGANYKMNVPLLG